MTGLHRVPLFIPVLTPAIKVKWFLQVPVSRCVKNLPCILYNRFFATENRFFPSSPDITQFPFSLWRTASM